MEKEFWITMDDDVEVYVKKWFKKETQPAAIIQLSHGMVEHINRYDDFAHFLLERNIFVYGNDHRGHGKTGEKQGLLGYFGDEDGFSKTAADLTVITNIIKEAYPGVPIILLGHSMGSFLAREYIQTHSSEIAGVILMGTGYHTTIGSLTAKSIAKTLPAKEKSEILNSLAFRTYNFKIPDNRTSFDWLSRDEAAVQTYIDDPLCGYVPTARFFHDLMDGLARIHMKNVNEQIRIDLPLFIVSGDADPVGHYGNGVFKVANFYDNLGLTDIKTMLFDGARHELLNETNKDEVYLALYDWIKAHLTL